VRVLTRHFELTRFLVRHSLPLIERVAVGACRPEPLGLRAINNCIEERDLAHAASLARVWPTPGPMWNGFSVRAVDA
jgi:hypothetical protein